jgi:hypothetical protein
VLGREPHGRPERSPIAPRSPSVTDTRMPDPANADSTPATTRSRAARLVTARLWLTMITTASLRAGPDEAVRAKGWGGTSDSPCPAPRSQHARNLYGLAALSAPRVRMSACRSTCA